MKKSEPTAPSHHNAITRNAAWTINKTAASNLYILKYEKAMTANKYILEIYRTRPTTLMWKSYFYYAIKMV